MLRRRGEETGVKKMRLQNSDGKKKEKNERRQIGWLLARVWLC